MRKLWKTMCHEEPELDAGGISRDKILEPINMWENVSKRLLLVSIWKILDLNCGYEKVMCQIQI